MPDTFNSSLLLLARQYRGMSQSEVAQASGINQGHYSRIENGLLAEGPSQDNVVRIANALGFSTTYFFADSEVAGLPLSVHPFNRKRAALGERALRSIHAELNIRLMHIRWLLNAVDLAPEAPLPEIDPDEGGGPETIARKIRQAWTIPDGPISNLTLLCERAGVLVVHCELDPLIDGVSMRVRGLPPCIFLNRNSPGGRLRFSLAHELGHAIMHRVPTDTIEDEANAFAAELLVPERTFRRQLIGQRVTLEVLARQKAYWKTSMNFLLYRASNLGVLNRNQSEYLWKQMAVRGWRTSEPQETEFDREKPSLFSRIVRLHSEELGYSLADFSRFLRISEADIATMYGRDLVGKGKPKLFVVK
ncbi:MAG: ImmA/IrrE family metallo-endopeptidase [Hyphomicrobium sp.]|uniref:helix-turn-helix domain-containing protein n=1 Tax=Hyphomicrobium sp. TaxID=82 RepID=UPI00132BC39C|nr:XRE family transcriptional regulator [Hyphomicrobium sp.]KAB2943875.1 MAG: ImmA/IrrE family metallo-endopeptidase [Hyphomicrobium sp.]MBZ0211854.1 ImmA/IrrE family metallo-endopeptidase [Hyphomicrobium sp.]